MKVITSPRRMQRAALAWRQAGLRIGLVPTMGALHEGHLSLVDRIRPACDVLVMSIYVNPTQFGPQEDYRRYPRPRLRDRKLAEGRGVDVLFRPTTLYAADASTTVREEDLSLDRCGEHRPGHFNGVATVVAKLFNLTLPAVAIFGQKDAQQCEVIERMARDLDFPVRILRAPIARDARGLALSSRNQYLNPEEYERAVAFARILREEASAGKGRGAARSVERRLRALPGVEVDYVTLRGSTLSAAVKIGRTRLIDNRRLRSPVRR